ncbi:unnamed protein product [Echinostoma caproni]|uniref:Uncharacterized protein n=1 Tax=Echinostoma caproni TaxID=27848 RepID=A0A183A1A6_9TREM|nr:unnamed protein product [Echinostoma caproni]
MGDTVFSSDSGKSYPDLALSTRAAGVNYFRLDPLIKEFEFCDDKELDRSRRFRLLQLRQAGVTQFKSLSVPVASRFIPSDVFQEYDKKRSETGIKDARGMRAYRVRHQLYVEKKSYKEVVIEEKIPNFFFILPLLRRMTEARRPLKAKHVERRPVIAQNIQSTGLRLLLTVHAAYNLPTRKTAADARPSGVTRHTEIMPIF